MSEKLKPCPFCGGMPEVVKRDVEPQGDPWYGDKTEMFVLCDCGVCLFDGAFHEGFGSHEGAKADAIAAWNRRELESASQPGGGWQPIETAPKDGTCIDLWIGGEFSRREPDCYWGLPHHECGEMGSLCDSDWHDLSEGWVGTYNMPISEFDGGPTHWMPLPAAPSAGNGGAEG